MHSTTCFKVTCVLFIQVVDEKDGGMGQVLLSLSGGQYRNNNLTNNNGEFKFANLVSLYSFLMREASSKRDCLSVCPSVRLCVCPYVTLFYIFAKCTLVTSSGISWRITQPSGLVS